MTCCLEGRYNYICWGATYGYKIQFIDLPNLYWYLASHLFYNKILFLADSSFMHSRAEKQIMMVWTLYFQINTLFQIIPIIGILHCLYIQEKKQT
jgi:hypothetical protein